MLANTSVKNGILTNMAHTKTQITVIQTIYGFTSGRKIWIHAHDNIFVNKAKKQIFLKKRHIITKSTKKNITFAFNKKTTTTDTRMKRIVFTLALVCLWLPMAGTNRVNLDSLYRVLDAAIDSADIYLGRKIAKFDSMKAAYRAAVTDSDRFRCAMEIYDEYVPFENDSALAYQYTCIDLADRMGRADLKAEVTVALAYQLANSGFYNEARLHFDEVPQQYLTGALLSQYLRGMNQLYGEMGFYSHDPRLSQQFHARANELRQQLMEQVDSTTATWLAQQSMKLNNEGHPAEALFYSDQWLRACQPGTRPYAIMAFFRSEIYKKLDDTEMQRYWLVQSALIDIRNAIMDQGALWSLANSLIRDDRDVDRAHRYIDFSWQCLSRFSTHMRSWLVAPVVARINDEYKLQLQTANDQLLWTILLISLLLVGLLLLLLYVQKKRRQLNVARNELAAANDELASLNTQLVGTNSNLSEANAQLQEANQLLQDTNEQLRQAIIHLNDSNRVKDEYIGKFLSICSEYIDKLDNYRIKVNRKLKANQYSDLLRMTSSEQLKEDELKELYDNFDTVFLRLFPTFIIEFNALLRPEERIVPSGKSQLNTDLRIFALIRLGIDESSKIAEFLHYSPNSIYAYHARIKNKAAGNRDDFERMVKEIGIDA